MSEQPPYPGQSSPPEPQWASGHPAGQQGTGSYPPPSRPAYGAPAGPPIGSYPQQPGYGSLQGRPPAPRSSTGNPLASADGLIPVLQIIAYGIAVIGVIGGFFAFAVNGWPGSLKFVMFAISEVSALGFSGVLLALAVLLKRPSAQ